jgi:sugar porter (SP) family MFS transporter
VKKGKVRKADKILHRLRSSSDEEEIKQELNDIENTIKESSDQSVVVIISELLKWKTLQRVILGVILQLFQQFTGMNVIMYYSTSIFCTIGGSNANYIATAIVGVVNFVTTLFTVFVVDKVGRKWLLLSGSFFMFIFILLAGVLIHIFQMDKEGSKDVVVGYFVALFIVLFVASFAYSWGPVAWVVTSEIFPLSVRGIAVSITTSGNWIGNFTIAMVTPLLLGSVLRTSGTFYIISGFLFASFFFVLFTLPETKGESLEKIDDLFNQPWLRRINLFYYLRLGCPWCRCGGNNSIHGNDDDFPGTYKIDDNESIESDDE